MTYAWIKRQPRWLISAAGLVLIIFLLNLPDGSSEWASWIQAIGAIAAIAFGFVAIALERRRTETQKLQFLADAAQSILAFLSTIEEAMEVRDPETTVSRVMMPGAVPTGPIRIVVEIVRSQEISDLPFSVVVGFREAIVAVEKYADALDETDFPTMRTAVENAFAKHDLAAPAQAAQATIDAIRARQEEIRSAPFFRFG